MSEVARFSTVLDLRRDAGTPSAKALGVTHWSSRLLGKHLGIADAYVEPIPLA
jgi:hypothetical protein